jgi:hypothetical protein
MSTVIGVVASQTAFTPGKVMYPSPKLDVS